ncbi:hypothetical protein [Rahnella aquatilis]|uniref:hypothetical protein n=1 Tax=Rahnella aquatilis TaxID=34038 RepID=UPI0036567A91
MAEAIEDGVELMGYTPASPEYSPGYARTVLSPAPVARTASHMPVTIFPVSLPSRAGESLTDELHFISPVLADGFIGI